MIRWEVRKIYTLYTLHDPVGTDPTLNNTCQLDIPPSPYYHVLGYPTFEGVTLILQHRLHHKPLPVRYPGPSKASHHTNSPPVFHKRSSVSTSGKHGWIWLTTVIKFIPFTDIYWNCNKCISRPQDHYKTQFSQQIYADYLNYHKRRNQILFPRWPIFILLSYIESLVPAQHQRTEELQMSQFFSVTYQPGEPIGFFFFQVVTRSDSEILNQQPKK